VAGSEQDRDLQRPRDLWLKLGQERRAQPSQLVQLVGLRAVIDALGGHSPVTICRDGSPAQGAPARHPASRGGAATRCVARPGGAIRAR